MNKIVLGAIALTSLNFTHGTLASEANHPLLIQNTMDTMIAASAESYTLDTSTAYPKPRRSQLTAAALESQNPSNTLAQKDSEKTSTGG